MSHTVLRRVVTVLTASLGLTASAGLAMSHTTPDGAGGAGPATGGAEPTGTQSPEPCDPGGVTIDDFIVWDGPGTGQAEVPVHWRRACPEDRVITFKTFDITARAGEDYVGVQSGSFILPAGSTRTTVKIQIIGDTRQEPTEYFGVRLLSGARFDDPEAIVILRDG